MLSPTITIMLCTCGRAQMLREALQSVRNQTARDSIARVVVSENSLIEESRDVCAEFPELPIVYVQQRPPIPSLLHLKAIWHLADSPLVAILHDDDWWAPQHLRSALDALEADAGCAAVFSSFLETYGPQGFSWLNQSYYFAWLASDADFSRPVIYYDSAAVMLACIINAGFHYSTVVGRSEAMWAAFSRNIERNNPFDNDRTFPVFLSKHGSVGYVTTPEVFVRNHTFRHAWSAEYLKKGHMKLAQETTRWLLANYPREVMLAAEKFRDVAERLDSVSSESVWCLLKKGTFEPQWSTLTEECGIELTAMRRPLDHLLLPRWAHELINSLMPPALLRWLHSSVWEQLMLFRQGKLNAQK